MKNLILDYEDVNNKIKEITNEGIIKRQSPLAITRFGLPIEYLTVGNGDKSIVITGATHGSEIITTDFVIKLMETINSKHDEDDWKYILENYKLHIIPMLNPEGYLISTSAIRKIIPKELDLSESEKICKEYFQRFKNDFTKEKGEPKEYQEMFKDIDYTCIPDRYSNLKNHIKSIYDKYDIPAGVLQMWSANGSGIDIQANNEYNPVIEKIKNKEDIYMSKRCDNINMSHPGPINCPYDKEEGFKLEIETKAISDLLDKLNKEGSLFMYLNYHSTGGLIYQRPSIPPTSFIISDNDLKRKEKMNYIMAKSYARWTKKNDGTYSVRTKQDNATSTNDILRLKYPNDILIELSPMGGNPLAPYGDIENNYKNVISSNIEAFKNTLNLGLGLDMLGNEYIKKIDKLLDKDDYDKNCEVIDMLLESLFLLYKRTNNYEKRKFN